MKYLFSALLFIVFSIAIAQENEELDNLISALYQIYEEQRINVDDQNLYSYTKYEMESENKLRKLYTKLENIPVNSREEELLKAVLQLDLADKIAEYEFKSILMPFNAEGGFYFWPMRYPSSIKIQSEEDANNYIRWMKSAAGFIAYNQQLMEEGIRQNIMRPRVIVKNSINMVKTFLPESVEQSVFYKPFTELPEEMPEKQQKEIKSNGKKTVEQSILRAYKEFYNFLENEYYPASPEVVGIHHSTNGKKYYENRIRHYTTLTISPDSVFNLGMSEVARIRKAMEDIIKEVKFEGSFSDFIQFLRTDPRFYPETPEELLHFAAWLSKKAEGELPNLFSHLYRTPFTVKPVPDHLAPTYTGGRYSGGGTRRAGEYWVNTYNLPSRTLYTLPALTLHEAVPGHHLQGVVSAENQDISEYRRRYYISAFGEGWGLYSEFLGEEMNMYSTPYEWFGRYTYEMWRACRLVVDVGMHYKGWTREQAVEFLSSNSALSLHEVNTEIDRYIGWPGQAVSYKIGELTIKSLRQKAEQALGDKFDIKEFHYYILKNGSIPLEELKKEIEKYINK